MAVSRFLKSVGRFFARFGRFFAPQPRATRWRELRILPRAAGLVANPYYEWARSTGFAYYGDANWLPVLVELKDTTAQDFAGLVSRMQQGKKDEQGWAAELRIPPFYASKPKRLSRPTRYLSVLATRKFLEDVYGGAAPSESIERFELGRAVQPSSTANVQSGVPRTQKKKPKGKDPEVVTAVIDDGMAFAHERFLSQDNTTRIEYFWDQLTPSNIWDQWGYGREIDKYDPAEGIDKRMQDSLHGALVDEEEVYRVSGHVDQTKAGHKPLALGVTHGAHVMDLAGNAARQPTPPPGERPIVAVQLPTATTADTSGASLGPQIYNGLVYTLDKAEAIAADAKTKELPVVVNVSYGIIAGPHDGSSVFEAAVDDLLDSSNPVDNMGKPKGPPFRLVLPAGNNYLSRCHACVSIDAGKSQDLRWRVLPDDWTESHVEIWLPDTDDNGNNTDLSITVAAPDGDSSTAFSAGAAQELVIGGNVVGQASYYPAGAAGQRGLVRLTLAPNAWPDGGLALAPAGLWRINIDNAQGKAAVSDIHAWIQRDDTPLGYPRRGRQSYFDDPDYARYDDGGREIDSDTHPRTANSYVKRRGTINAIATGKHPIVIGGMRRSDWTPAAYSGSGPVTDHPPGRGLLTPDGPDAMAISDDTPSHHGVRAAGSRSGSSAAMHGTSVAAPQIACWVAEELAQGRPGGREDVINYTQQNVAAPLYTEQTPPAGAAPQPTRERGGAGRIEFPSRIERFER
jgi:hypothetical protein